MNNKLATALVVAVIAGNVEVGHDVQRYALALGEDRVADKGKPTKRGKPDVTGVVVGIAKDGKSITISYRVSKKAPPRTTTVKIGDQTKLAYNGIAPDQRRPMVRDSVAVWLDQDSKDLAAGIKFTRKVTKTKKGKKPNFVGRVTQVSADGTEITIEQPPAKKGSSAQTRVVKIDDNAKLAYKGIKPDARKPTVGFNVRVWLKKASSDVASAVVFVPGKSGKSSKPVKPTKPAKPKQTTSLLYLKGLKLTEQQKAKLEPLRRQYADRIKAVQQRRESVLTDEQKQARSLAKREVAEAGLKDSRLVKLAVDAAAQLTADQKNRLQTLAQEQKQLYRSYYGAVKKFLANEKAKPSQK